MIFVLLQLFFLVFSSHVFAALYWTQANGPFGAYGRSVAISQSDPNTIYLGTVWAGIYLSTDGGETWTAKNNGLMNLSLAINSIAINPYDSREAFAATAGNGVARTSNGGDDWEPVNSNLGFGTIFAVAIDPRNPDNVYAATYSGVRKSTNKGDFWSDAGLGGLGEILALKIVSGETGNIIYAGSWGSGVWRSTDEALTWVNILSNESVTAVGVSASSPETHLYAAVRDKVETGYYMIKRTADGGLTWTNTNYNPAKSTDTNYRVNSIAVNSITPEVAFAATGYSTNRFGLCMYKTTNEGASWTQIKPDPTNPTNYSDSLFYDISYDPANRSKVYACDVGRGLYVSTNEGASWSFKNKGINNVELLALKVVSSESGPVLFAGTLGLGVFRSTNEGDSFEEVNTGIFSTSIRDILWFDQDPVDLSIIYAGARDAANAGTVYKSTNGGSTWQSKSSGLAGAVNCVGVDPISHEVLYAGTSAGNYFYRSLNSGETWSGWSLSLPGTPVYALIVSSFGGRAYLHVGVQDKDPRGLYRRRTMPEDPSWESVGGIIGVVPPSVYAFAPNYMTPEAIYCTSASYLCTKTLEAYGVTPRLGFPAAVLLWALVADPKDPSVLYTTQLGRHIYKVSGYASSYALEESGLEVNSLRLGSYPLALDHYSDPENLYAEVIARSVWRARTLSGSIPTAPINVNGSAETSHSIRWMWTDTSLIEQGFRVYDPSRNLKTSTPSHPSVGPVSTVEGGLDINKAYMRKVSAYNASGSTESSLSPWVYTAAAIPGKPVSLEVGITNITITWEAMGNPGYTSYEVQRSTTEVGSGLPIYWVYVATLTTTEYPDTGLTFETTYYYRVRALNGDGIPTGFATSEGITTEPPIPSDDIYPPRITKVKFNDRSYYSGGGWDIIFHTPRISAYITDYASTEPYYVTPEGVDRNLVKIRFGDYLFDVPSSALTTITPTIEFMDYEIPGRLGSANYICTIEASDMAWPWYNRGAWSGKVKVMGERVQVVGSAIAYPSPFRPLRGDIATISYTLSTNASVTILMYDISGQAILTRKFSSGFPGGKAGYNQFNWNGKADYGKVVGNGIYVFKIVSGGRAIGTGKVVVMD